MVLASSPHHQKLASDSLFICFGVQNRYGRQASEAEFWIKQFLRELADLEPDSVLEALTLWRQKFTELPTPADIRRMALGKPMLSREVYARAKKIADDNLGNFAHSWQKKKAQEYCKYYEIETVGYEIL